MAKSDFDNSSKINLTWWLPTIKPLRKAINAGSLLIYPKRYGLETLLGQTFDSLEDIAHVAGTVSQTGTELFSSGDVSSYFDLASVAALDI